MIKLNNWFINKRVGGSHYHAHGISTGHPKLSDGMDITTSAIENLKFDNDNNRIIMLTHSQNEYELPLSQVLLENIKDTNIALESFGLFALDADKCRKLNEGVGKQLLEKVESVLRNNELYLQISGVFVQKAFFRNTDGAIREIGVSPHIGTFVDSYLVTDWNSGEVDFRYFDKLNAIEPYHWSDGLEALQIDNIGSEDITFLSGDNIICKAGEVTCIDKSQMGREGLFSPDAVNGKCVMPFNKDEVKEIQDLAKSEFGN